MSANTVTCATCGNEVDSLELFPGSLCLACYEITQIGAPMPTAEDIVTMWGGPAVRRRTRNRR